MTGNKNILLNNINISGIISNPVEIIGVSVPIPNTTAYGGKVQVGPIGDVLQIENIQDSSGKYQGTNLSHAKLILAKVQNETYKKIGTTNITNKNSYDWNKFLLSTNYKRFKRNCSGSLIVCQV